MSDAKFEITEFLPYLLTMAAEESSREFRTYYKNEYGMLRTEWRVLFHLGRYGAMTATEMGRRSKLHKTKISRAVSALAKRRFLARHKIKADKRQELLALTPSGQAAYLNLSGMAKTYNASIIEQLSRTEHEAILRLLRKLSKL